MKYISLLIIALIPLLIVHSAHAANDDMMSVKLERELGNPKTLKMELKGNYLSLESLILKEGVTYKLSLQKGYLIIKGDGQTQKVKRSFSLIPKTYDEHHVLTINGHPYLGAMTFTIEKKKVIRPINQLPLEDYLKGVVPFEVYSSWGLETLKAQALAARTYAVSHLGKTIDDTTRYQAYGGYAWKERTTKAVEETKGEVITYHHHLIDAFYSASNGGETESNANVWGGTPESYYPIKKDPFDPIEPWNFTLHKIQIKFGKNNWNNPFTWNDLQERDKKITSAIKRSLANKGYSEDIKIMSIPEFYISPMKDASGRALRGSFTINFLQRFFHSFIVYDQVRLDNVPIDYIRPMIGATTFKSYLVDGFKETADAYYVKGRGFGHGVGMSQWGAHVMGDAGKSYKQILKFYFPGTTIIQYQHT